MKKPTFNSGFITGTFFWSVIALFFFSTLGIHPFGKNAFAQVYKSRPVEVSKQKINGIDEATLRKKMKADGLSDPVIETLIAQRKMWMQQGKNVSWTNVKNASTNPTPNATCGDMGGEHGWGSWLGETGTANSGPTQTWTPPAILPFAPNFSITTGPGIDPNTPGPAGPPTDPTIPFVCPGFGTASIEIGEPCTAGCVAEQLTYPLTVTTNDTNFVYAYAIVIEDAGHAPSDQPFVNFSVYDQNGVLVPQCANFTYTGGPSIPGFHPVNGTGCGYLGTDQYKPWTLVGINLSAYVGTTITIVITNVDCAQCGHWAYSYWDFLCGNASLSAGCIGNQSTICGPIDPNIAYTYQWFQNSTPLPPPNGISQCITVTPAVGDTFSVEVQQPSGCNFHLGYVPAVLQPYFNHTGHCGTYTFMDSSIITPAGNTITGWNWSFPGGTPASSTSQTTTVTYNTPGTYSVTMNITCSAGCTASITHTISVSSLPTAAINTSPACYGNPVTLTDGSVSPAGDPITQWSWSMPAGTPATAATQNATTTYNTSGTYTVTLTVTTQSGCTNSIPQQVVVYAPPVALFSGSGTGCIPICVTNYTDLSTSTNGNITSWEWTFPGGSPSNYTSTAAPGNPGNICYNVSGSFGATLIVTTVKGCKDTITIAPIVTPRPWPHADFCVTPDQAPATDPVFNFCDLWTPNPGVTSWVWDYGDNSPQDSGNSANNLNTSPVHSYSATVSANDFYSYNVCLKVRNQYGCWDTICKTVELIPEFTFYIPNTFTPNGDNANDFFFGKGRGIKEYNIWIFDRWGNMIWDCHHTGKNTDWDSNMQDGMSSFCKWDGVVVSGGIDMSGGSRELAEEDVYVWKVKLTDVFNKKHNYIGHVSIVK